MCEQVCYDGTLLSQQGEYSVPTNQRSPYIRCSALVQSACRHPVMWLISAVHFHILHYIPVSLLCSGQCRAVY